ncbi:TonB-dependent receptor domain-containing protein [Granulicella aggregans]|uniref:TonB-dependent receptor domain-containing protein n=1 Tax=Granulicella aggregans TaxID=474949 RepID=UPI0021DFC74C|nr:TonB-dependent receptor [Granulicella aggregans]
MKLSNLRAAAYALRSVFALAIIAFGFASTRAFAQTTSISGSVQDAQKAQISGAKISITRTESGEHREARSNDDGFFIFPVLIPGHYDLTVEKDGFGSETKTGVQVLTGQTSTVDLVLQTGQVQQSIDVESDIPLLQTTTSTISNVVENETIVNLPLLDRRATQLQRLNGFVIGTGTGSGSTFAIAGGRGNNANYTVDGGTTQNLLQGVPTQMFDLPIDALQEFNLTVSDYTADLGRSGGGVIQMTTKSGTNQFHGSGYIYYRSNNLQAKPLFATVNPPLQYKLFGGSIGGPIIKDKTHFFFTYEGKRATTTSVLTLSVPSAAERLGDFSAIATPVIDPSTGKQAIGDDGTLNKLPSAELDPYGLKLASYYPLPNIAGAPINSNNFTANDPATAIINDYVVRIDHVFREKDTVYGRFLAQPDHTVTSDVFPTPGTDVYGALSHNYYYNPSATWNHIFTPSLINEARFTYSRRQSLSISHSVDAAVNSQLALPGINSQFFPGVSLSGLAAIGNNSQQQRLQTPIISNEYTDNLSWQRGNHQFKFGVDYRTSADGDLYSPSAGGFFTFNNTGISTNAAAGSLANLVLGRVASATRQETELLYSVGWSWGLYAQDNWHVNSKLTLNYGLRWDIDSPRYLTNNRQNSFDVNAINPISNTPGIITFSGINGQSKYANNFDYTNFGPRVGFAYTPVEHSVVRGGGAILFPGEYDQATPIVDYTGFSNAITLQSANPGVGTPAFLLKNNATDGTGKAVFPTLDQLTPGFGAVAVGQKPTVAPQFIQPKRHTGYLYQANLDVQHEFKGSLLLDVGYLGTYGHHLASVSAESINQITPTAQATLSTLPAGFNTQTLRPFPQFSNVQVLYPDIGQSKYNGVNIGVQKRYSRGLQYQVNYTFSKFVDNEVARNELAGYPGTDTYTDYYHPQTRYGLSGNDVRQRLMGNALYELPFGRGKLVNLQSRWLDSLVGGWTVGALTEIHSGTALSVIDATNNTGTYSDGVRPNLDGNPNSLSSSRARSAKIAQWFNTGAFTQNAAFTFGNAPRTFGRGPRLVTSDASLLKKVNIRENHAIEFRLEASNVFNHASLGNPNTQFGSATFGKVSTLQPGGVASRTLQLAAHYTF